jgi:hypothetical protein
MLVMDFWLVFYHHIEPSGAELMASALGLFCWVCQADCLTVYTVYELIYTCQALIPCFLCYFFCMTDLLSLDELKSLNSQALNEQVEMGLKEGALALARAGMALKEIQRRREYPNTFEAHVMETFGISRSRAYQLIRASEILADLADVFPLSRLPKSDSAVLPMWTLTKGQRIQVWSKALDEAKRSPGQGTVKRLVKELLTSP